MGGWGYVEVRLPKLCLTRISTEKLFGEGVAQVVCGRALGRASNSCVGGMHPCAAGGWGYIEVRLPKLCQLCLTRISTRISTENLFGEAVAQVVCGRALGGASNSCVHSTLGLPFSCSCFLPTENLFGAQAVCGQALGGAFNSCVGGPHPVGAIPGQGFQQL